MSDKEKKITLKSFRETIKAKDGDDKYVVFKKEKTEDVTFPKDEKGSKQTIKVLIKKESEKDDQATEHEVEVTNDSGPIFTNIKLPAKIGTIELKEEVSLPVKGYEKGFWIGSVVLLVVLVVFGYWWFSSSRKEDKEEEGL